MPPSRIITAFLGLALLSACFAGTGPTAATEEKGVSAPEEAPPIITTPPPAPETPPPPPTPISGVREGPLAMNPPGGITPREDPDWIEIVFSAWRAVYGTDFAKTMAIDTTPEVIPMPASGELDLAYLVEGRMEKVDGPLWVHAPEGSNVRLVLRIADDVRLPEDPVLTSCKTMLVENASPGGHNLYVPHLAVKAGEMSFYHTPLMVPDTPDCSAGLAAATEEAVDAFAHGPGTHPLGSLQIQAGATIKRERRRDLVPLTPLGLPPGPILVPVREPAFKIGP